MKTLHELAVSVPAANVEDVSALQNAKGSLNVSSEKSNVLKYELCLIVQVQTPVMRYREAGTPARYSAVSNGDP